MQQGVLIAIVEHGAEDIAECTQEAKDNEEENSKVALVRFLHLLQSSLRRSL